MKKSLLLLLLVTSPLIAQPKKYQSLLWEISGNGLAKKSYLYGSMHVSDKVSYHLSDAFFTHLLAADFVANESEPSTWIDLYDVLGAPMNQYRQNNAFYARFYQKPIGKEDLFPLFMSNNNMMNNLLFRTSEVQQDYQEETYLDMFIYQTGKKYKKQVVGLENAKTSMISIMGADTGDMAPKEENTQAIVKMLKERSFNQALLDYYRDKNLDMLDSLYSLMAPGKYLKTLLYDRNIVMSKSIDSLARKGSLFAAIGAAHLPGKNGVIEQLRKKGYTVTPVVDAYTDKGRGIKKQIEEYFLKPQFETRSTQDDMIRLPMHPQPIYNADDIGTPDLANGGIINLKRVLLRDYLRKDASTFNPQTVDSLFYENIPGEIIEKKFFKEDNYSGYDIRNRTKTGNSQHYRYYITPLELICVSMSGSGNYVRQYENDIFNNIHLRKSSTDWETVSPTKGGFSVQTPGYYTLYGNREGNNPQDIELNAWDEKEKAWYFVTERTINDNENLEDTDFELTRIQDEFYNQYDAKNSAKEIARTPDSYESSAKIGDKSIELKTVVSGQKYYLLGSIQASAANASKFFSSFKIEPFHYAETTSVFTDSTSYFSVSLPEKENQKLFWKIKKPKNNFRRNQEKQNVFEAVEGDYAFTSASGKTVNLNFWKYHRYDYRKNLDTIWSNVRKIIKQDYSNYDEELNYDDEDSTVESVVGRPQYQGNHNFNPDSTWEKELGLNSGTYTKRRTIVLVNEKISYDKASKLNKFEVTAQSPKSRQAIKYTIYQQDGYIWWFKALVEKDYKNDDAFIEKTMNSFRPVATKPDLSIYQSKTELFIADANSEKDSIRFSAFKSVDELEFQKQDLPALKKFIETFTFRPEETQAVSILLDKIGSLDDPGVMPLLESSYKKDNANTIVQFAVLSALAQRKSKNAYKKIMELLEYDLPLSDNSGEISSLFGEFGNDLDNSKILFPDIFQFYGIREYHDPIVQLTTGLFDAKLANPKKLSSYRKMILTNAKLEYKRTASWKAKGAAKQVDDEGYDNYSPAADLQNYLQLIYPFRKDREVSELLNKISALQLPEINLELVRLQLRDGLIPDPAAAHEILSDPKTSFSAYRMLSNKSETASVHWQDEVIARAAITEYGNLDIKSDSLTFLEKRAFNIEGKPVTIFFYKLTSKEKTLSAYNRENKISAIAFVNNKDAIDPDAYKQVTPQAIGDEDNISENFGRMIDRLQNGSHTRASFGKHRTNGFRPSMDGEY